MFLALQVLAMERYDRIQPDLAFRLDYHAMNLFGIQPSQYGRRALLKDQADLDRQDLKDLLVAFELDSGRPLEQEAAKHFRTVGDVVDYLQEHIPDYQSYLR